MNTPEITFYSYLSGLRSIPKNLLIPISKVLNVPVSEIFKDEDTIDFVREYLKNPSEKVEKELADVIATETICRAITSGNTTLLLSLTECLLAMGQI